MRMRKKKVAEVCALEILIKFNSYNDEYCLKLICMCM